jgi:hypothetical protein
MATALRHRLALRRPAGPARLGGAIRRHGFAYPGLVLLRRTWTGLAAPRVLSGRSHGPRSTEGARP